jgi:TolB-like protein
MREGFLMYRIIVSCLLFSLFVGCASTQVTAPKPNINCNIMPFEARAGVQPGEAESVAELFSAELQNTGRFTVIDRKQINTILQEQGFQAAQAGNDGYAKAAKILAVHWFFTGSVGKLGDNYIVNVKMISVETADVRMALTKTFDDDLEDIHKKFIPNLVKEIMLNIDGPETK